MSTKVQNHNNETTPHWSSIKEAGTMFGLQFLRLVHRVFGRRAVSVLLLPTVAYFVLFRPLSRQSSKAYLALHAKAYPQQWARQPGILQTAKHYREFAETVVDKLLSWFVDIDADQFLIENNDTVEALLKDPRGQLIIGSHFGNLEYCRGFMHRYKDKIINILVHDKHSANYNKLMQQLNPDSRLNVFQVSDFDIPTMLRIKQKIDDGEWIFIAGDRSPVSGGERTVAVEFLGKTAYLPVGPYMLAKGLACPVKLMFSYRNYHSKENSVHFDVIDFADKIEISRKDRATQLQALAQRFADALQQKCRVAPYQWFNFYDFWATTPKAKSVALNS